MAIDMNKMLMKGVMKMISPEQIEEAIKGVTEFAIKEKENYPLNKFEGETDHAIMIYEVGNTLFFSIAIIKDQDEQMTISRFAGTKPLIEMIKEITKNI